MAKKEKSENTPKNFEAAILELEGLVQKLEAGELPLDEAMNSFETGMRLAKFCEDRLNDASGRIEKVMKYFSGKSEVLPLTQDELDELNPGESHDL
jgi:exodeoxyribonuclease VII small subunit